MSCARVTLKGGLHHTTLPHGHCIAYHSTMFSYCHRCDAVIVDVVLASRNSRSKKAVTKLVFIFS